MAANSEALTALIAELRTLDRGRDAARMSAILEEASRLVDRATEPKKWAAFRSMFAQIAEPIDPDAALAAYRDALTVWNEQADRDSWVTCHSGVGMILMRRLATDSGGPDEAIEHLQLAVADQPFLAQCLATLYRVKTSGDLAENWRQRMHFLQIAQAQVSPQDAPVDWASYQNEIGIAYAAEPNADYAQAVEKRIACHLAALQALDAGQHSGPWIDTALSLSEAYLFRVLGAKRENEDVAEDYLRQATAACGPDSAADLRRRVHLSFGRLLCERSGDATTSRLHEALDAFDQAVGTIDAATRPALIANVEALRVNVYRKLIQLGETRWVEAMKASVAAALRGFDPMQNGDARRRVLQVQAEGLIDVADYRAACDSLESAVDAGEQALVQATTLDGRIERVFQLADSSALLCYCCLELGDIPRALGALERGKTRVWRSDGGVSELDTTALQDIIPHDGAALFPVFAWRKGAVIAATRTDDAPRYEVVWLPNFGKPRLLELQRGDLATGKLGGWLEAYSLRRSAPEMWVRAIDAVGTTLHEEIWAPVLARLSAMGVDRGAELLWFPQGGSGVFPMHAAWHEVDGKRHWLIEDHPIRYAPSIHALRRKPLRERAAHSLIVANPVGDLPFCDLECAWVLRGLAGTTVSALSGALATKEAVVASLPMCDIAHFATHATFNLVNPFDSAITLALGEALTLQQLLPLLQDRAPSFVALSACESGMARVTAMPDESLGFPAALLERGTRTVLATLWPVDDAATSLLMHRFYQEFGHGKATAAQALRKAQVWLRTVTVGEISKVLGGMRQEAPPVGPFAARFRTRMFALDESLCPFLEPYFWAAFTVSGE